MTLVSVILTVYNLEKYVDMSIQSVLNQSYRNIEIIVVDDCSTDQSAKIINGYGSSLQYFCTDKNSGVLGATIEGLKLAKGEIVCFLDGDDIWHVDKVKEVVAKFKEDQRVFMVSHDYSYIDALGKPIVRHDDSQLLLKKTKDTLVLSKIMADSILEYRGHVWLGSAYSVRNNSVVVSKFIEWVNELSDVFNTYQDHPLATFWIANHPDGLIAYVSQKMLFYRIHNNNYSGAYNDKKSALKIALKAYNTSLSTYSILKKYNVEDRRVLRRQQSKLLYYKYLLQLLQGKYGKAFKSNIQLSLSFYSLKDLLKEWTRYIGIIVLRDYFFTLISRQK